MIRVAVDAMGGDRGPEEIVAGALEARTDDVVPVLVGPHGLDTHGLELIEAPDVIAMDEKPTDAVRGKPDSSLVRACRAVGAGDAQAVVSASRFLKETRCQAVKLEGGSPPMVERVRALIAMGIPVMGHIGFTPQSVNMLGGFRVQGRAPGLER